MNIASHLAAAVGLPARSKRVLQEFNGAEISPVIATWCPHETSCFGVIHVISLRGTFAKSCDRIGREVRSPKKQPPRTVSGTRRSMLHKMT
jgi:hypothetical protein